MFSVVLEQFSPFVHLAGGDVGTEPIWT